MKQPVFYLALIFITCSISTVVYGIAASLFVENEQ